MSERKIITFEQLMRVFATNGADGVKRFFESLPDAEPIIEASREEWSRLNFLGTKEELERLSAALSAIGEVKFKEAACASKN